MAKERCAAFEGLFKPELWGKDTRSIPDMVYDAVMACSIDNRKDMCRFVAGSFLFAVFLYILQCFLLCLIQKYLFERSNYKNSR